MGGWIGFAPGRHPPSPKTPKTAHADTVARYPGRVAMDLAAGRKGISAEDRATRFGDGR
jgi:hypothetical protein